MCVRLPARLTASQAGELLNFTEAEIAVLMRIGLLKPLAHPAQNSHKWFATEYILALDDKWVARATAAIYTATRQHNAKPQRTQQ